MAKARTGKSKVKGRAPKSATPMGLPTGLPTSEFRREFQAETGAIVRRRLVWFIGIWGGLGLLSQIAVLLGWFAGGSGLGSAFRAMFSMGDWETTDFTVYGISFGAWFLVYGFALWAVLFGRVSEKAVLWISLGLVASDGLNAIFVNAAALEIAAPILLVLFLTHTFAAAMFPWTPKQAVYPAAIVLGTRFVVDLIFDYNSNDSFGQNLVGDTVQFALSPLAVFPGTMICWIRHSARVQKFGMRFMSQQYGALKQELQYARLIHESVFPEPRGTGEVRMDYRYQPMRQIGGDYLFSHGATSEGGGERFSVVMVDVTGHGVAAALSVNRLHGEVELMFADNPRVEPGEVMRKLNRYVNLTLARHSIYATAVAIRVDTEAGTLEYASAGHPPVMLRAIDGTISELRSTALMLGAAPDESYESETVSVAFGAGDSAIAYTDGATEVRDEQKRMLRVSGLKDLLRPGEAQAPGDWARVIVDAVTRHRAGGAIEDDTLVLEICRPLKSQLAAEAPPVAEREGEDESEAELAAR